MNLFILGSTGSVGRKTLEVVNNNPDLYRAYILHAHSNTDLLLQQVRQFSPAAVVVTDKKSGEGLKGFLPEGVKLFIGQEHLPDLVAQKEVDTLVAAASGICSVESVISALIHRKKIALANKEVLVAAGSIIMGIARGTGQIILPVDSEHSAIFQCLTANKTKDIEKIMLTASGGAFRLWEKERIAKATAADALCHPTWSMGKKISVDSATMFNKGLEIIEASWLFDLPPQKIEVLVHPQSTVHSLVEFCDKNTLAVLSHPDMYLPISFALSFPKRIACDLPALSLAGKSLDFFPPDQERFPMLGLAKEAAVRGGLCPAVVNAANDVAVQRFLEGDIGFYDIHTLARNAYEKFDGKDVVTVENIKRVTAEVADFIRSAK